MSKILELKNVTVNRKKSILSDISLSIKKGEKVAILGPNGCGKTTLINVALGLIRPTEGTVQKITDILAPYQVGVHLQEQKYNGLMTVRELLDLLLFSGSYSELIEKYNLFPILDKRLSTLSGGEKQKVYLTAVFENNPEVFVLDEFTTSLDLDNQEYTVGYLKEGIAENKTIILVTHHFQEAELLCDRLIFLKDGRIIEDGLVSDLYEKYSVTSRIRVKVVSKNTELLNIPGVEVIDSHFLVFEFETDDEKLKILNLLNSHSNNIVSYEIIPPTIKKLYKIIYSIKEDD